MAYNGYLIKVGNYTIPQKFIKAESYSAYINMQDVDPWTDADGYVHRTAVELKAMKIEFETPPLMTGEDFGALMENIRNNFISTKDKTCKVKAFIPELNDYVEQKSYLVDLTPQIYGIFQGVVKYNAIRLAFVGGVA